MTLLAVIGQLVLGFIVGTAVLWICSLTVKTPNANIKAAAIYNAIMVVFEVVFHAIGLLFLHTESGIASWTFCAFILLILIVSLLLLMRIYEISFWRSVWLAVTMSVVYTLVGKLFEVIT